METSDFLKILDDLSNNVKDIETAICEFCDAEMTEDELFNTVYGSVANFKLKSKKARVAMLNSRYSLQ